MVAFLRSLGKILILKKMTFGWFLGCFFVLIFPCLSLSKSNFQSSINVGLLGDLYFQRNVHNVQGSIDILLDSRGYKDRFMLNLGAGALVGDSIQSYVKIPESYYQIGFPDKANVVLGRSIQKWSYLDDDWMMGIIQPFFKWNRPMPERQGLTGIFLNIPLDYELNLMFFSSYVFLPSQGPGYKLVGGEITSSNPWFTQPVRIINFGDRETKLNYIVNFPKTKDIIFKPSYGGQLRTPYKKKDWVFNLFYLSKPVNDLIIPFDGQLNLTTFRGDVTIQPTVARHNVYGLDAGWNFGFLRTVFSWLHESSIQYIKIPEFTYPIIPKQDLFSVLQWIRLTKSQSISLSYLKSFRQPNRIEGDLSGSQISTFLVRNPFENTFRLKWEGSFQKTSNDHHFKTSVSCFQSFLVDHSWIQVAATWILKNQNIQLKGFCDFFGGYKNSPVDGDFISQYQDNDRCLFGGNYVF